MFHMVAARSSNDVFIVLFMHCLQVDYSQNLRILQCFDHLSTSWPLGLESKMALIKITIDI
jgi:hypothetical protein